MGLAPLDVLVQDPRGGSTSLGCLVGTRAPHERCREQPDVWEQPRHLQHVASSSTTSSSTSTTTSSTSTTTSSSSSTAADAVGHNLVGAVLGAEQVGAHGRLEIERRLGAPASTGAVLGAPAHALGQRLKRLAEGFATGQAPTYLHAISRNQSQSIAINRTQSQSVALSRNQSQSGKLQRTSRERSRASWRRWQRRHEPSASESARQPEGAVAGAAKTGAPHSGSSGAVASAVQSCGRSRCPTKSSQIASPSGAASSRSRASRSS